MNFTHYYKKAIEFLDYEKLLDDKFSLHNLHYKNFNLNQNDFSRIANLSATNILVITEPWCGDSVAILPVIKKIADANSNWNLKLILRDKNLDLMEKFLTNGNKAIPIFLFLDNNYNLVFNWGPRPEAAQKIFEQNRDKIKTGEIEKSKVILKIRQLYSKDKGQSISKEVLDLLYTTLK